MTAVPPPDPSLWEWISSPGVTNIATAAGVLVAVGIAGHSARQRRNEQRAAEETEARQFRINLARRGNPGMHPKFLIGGRFTGPAPLYDVHIQVWPGGLTLADDPVEKIIDVLTLPTSPENDFGFAIEMPDGAGLDIDIVRAWRVTWQDRHGLRWVIDHIGQVTPRRFKAGETPRSNG